MDISTLTRNAQDKASQVKSHRFRNIMLSYGVTAVLSGTFVSVTYANHPEYTPCCATISKADIQKNLAIVANEAKAKQADAAKQLSELRTLAEARK